MSLILLDFGNQLRRISYLYKIDNSIFSILHTNNTGSSFGLFQNNAHLLAYFGIGVIVFFIYYIYRYVSFNDKLILLSLTLFSAGVLGNVIERLKFGYVIDYIKLNFINFPIFNMFDIMICSGCVLYIVFVLFFSKKVSDNK